MDKRFDLDRLMAEEKAPREMDYEAEMEKRLAMCAEASSQLTFEQKAFLAGMMEGMMGALRMMKVSA